MPTMKGKVEKGQLEIGVFSLPVSVIGALDAIEATGKSIKLHDGRVEFMHTPKGSETPVKFTVALVVTRDPLDDTESLKVAAKAAEQKERKATKASEEQAARDREFRRGADLNRDAIMGTLANINVITNAAKALNLGGEK